jgi:hypothetical protein
MKPKPLRPRVPAQPGTGGDHLEEPSWASSPWRGLGARGGTLGLATASMGLPRRTSSTTRKAKNWIHVDQARAIDAFEWSSASAVKARRRPL